MSDCSFVLLSLSPEEREALEAIARSRKSEARLVQRARVLLAASQSGILLDVAQAAGVTSATAKGWIRRFRSDNRPIAERLCDAPRSGAPARFTAEALCQIVALACEKPEASGRPISHWTPRELAEEAAKRKIVESISARHVGRFLKRCRPKTAL